MPIFFYPMKAYRQRTKSEIDILSWIDKKHLQYLINMHCLICVSHWLFWITWPVIIFDSRPVTESLLIIWLIWLSNIDSIQKEKGRFHRLNLKKHDLSCSDSDHGFSPSSIKVYFGIWWFSNKLAALREKSYDKTINYSLWDQ